jgi:hypothetical protein
LEIPPPQEELVAAKVPAPSSNSMSVVAPATEQFKTTLLPLETVWELAVNEMTTGSAAHIGEQERNNRKVISKAIGQ